MILSRLTQPFARMLGTQGIVKTTEYTPRERYELLDRYYQSNGMYDDIRQAVKSIPAWAAKCVELRNPTTAAVEFYPSKLWPGVLPGCMPLHIDGSNAEALQAAIEQIWKWSNWSAKKQVAARNIAKYGDLFIRVTTSRADPVEQLDPESGAKKKIQGKAKSVYLELIHPKYVTDFKLDERGIVRALRYDTPQGKDAGGASHTYTEYWNDVGVQKWNDHAFDYRTPLDRLGPADEALTWKDLKFDFIPWVHAPFRDLWESAAEEQRGLPLIWPVLTKIDAANLTATTLHSLMYRYGRPTIAVSANWVDAKGKPMPAPTVQGEAVNPREFSATSTIDYVGDEEVWRLPGLSKVEHMVPNINWQAQLDLLLADLNEIKRDLPELYYYDVAAAGVESGRALLYRMAPAIDRVIEVRGNAESALIRAQEMALSVGIAYGVLDKSLGSYDKGDFNHSFVEREVVMSDPQSLGETAKVYVEAGVPVGMAMKKFAHFSDDDIAEIDAAQAKEREAATGGGVQDLTDNPMRVARALAAKEKLAAATQPDIAATLQATVDKGVTAMTQSGALAKVMQKNTGK